MGLEIFKDYKCDGQISIEDYLNENKSEHKEGEIENEEEQKYSSFNLSKKGLNPLQQMQIRQMAHAKDKEIQEEVFRRMMVIPLMAFMEAYKRKPSTKKVQEYFSYCMALYEEFGDDTYTMDDVKKYLASVGIEYSEYIKE